jgi:hypothetical protein
VNAYLDHRLDALTRRLGGRYTRYADDLTFSFSSKMGGKQRKLLVELRHILKSDGYEIQQDKKVRVQRRHQHQAVTGLVVNVDTNLPRQTRMKIRAMQHQRRLGNLSEEDLRRLAGYEALLEMLAQEHARFAYLHPGSQKQSKPVLAATTTPVITTILFVGADPQDRPRLRTQTEQREIETLLVKQSRHRESYRVVVCLSSRPKDITQALLDHKPQLVHFSGHGEEKGELCFEDNEGKAYPVQPDELVRLLEYFSKHVRCVVLNACYTLELARSLSEVIDVAIGVEGDLPDEAALAFSTGFYLALGNQDPSKKGGLDYTAACELGKIQYAMAAEGEKEPELFYKIKQ